jgi:hypothetical protein
VNRRHARVLAAGAAAVLAAALGAVPALAVNTWTIRPGGAFTATSGKATLKDATTGAAFPCRSLRASGTFSRGSGLPGAGAGSISAVSFNTCTSPLGPARARRVGLVFTLRAADLPWHVNLSSDNAGVVTGTISHVRIHGATSGCRWVIDGTSATAGDGVIRFSYTDGTGKLALLGTGGNLHAYHVRGCFGLLNNRDRYTIGATFTLSPEQTITSP